MKTKRIKRFGENIKPKRQRYQIVKVTGLGMWESRYEYFPTGLFFNDKEKAETKAKELWLENTTEQERNSGWCGLHYEVHEVN